MKFNDRHLEKYKYFEMDDEPNAPGLTHEEVEKVQKHLENVPHHLIPCEIKKFDLLNDRKIIEQQKRMQTLSKEKLMKMEPSIKNYNKFMIQCEF